MAAPKRTKFQRESDLARIAKMHLEQMSQYEIAAELGLSQPQVNYDLKEIEKRWREASLTDINEAKQRELERIDRLERMYRDAYERSCQERVKTRTEQEGIAIKAVVTREQRDGNPAFLSGIQNCIEQRCRILGIFEVAKVNLDWRGAVEAEGLDAGEAFEQMVATAKRILEEARRNATSKPRRKPRGD
jgi:predicted transcriptional regulator